MNDLPGGSWAGQTPSGDMGSSIMVPASFLLHTGQIRVQQDWLPAHETLPEMGVRWKFTSLAYL